MMEREGGISTFASLLFTNENLKSPSVREYVTLVRANTMIFATDEWRNSSMKTKEHQKEKKHEVISLFNLFVSNSNFTNFQETLLY